MGRSAYQKRGKGEHETTMHSLFTHASCVTKFSVFIIKTKAEKLGVSTCTARRQGFASLSMDLRSCRSLPKVQRTDLKIFVEP